MRRYQPAPGSSRGSKPSPSPKRRPAKVVHINEKAFNKGPLFAHLWLNRMYRTKLIPKHTVTVSMLGEKRFVAGQLAKLAKKAIRVDV